MNTELIAKVKSILQDFSGGIKFTELIPHLMQDFPDLNPVELEEEIRNCPRRRSLYRIRR